MTDLISWTATVELVWFCCTLTMHIILTGQEAWLRHRPTMGILLRHDGTRILVGR